MGQDNLPVPLPTSLRGGRELILFLLVLRIVSDLAGGLGVLRREVTTVKRLYCMQAGPWANQSSNRIATRARVLVWGEG